MTIEMRGISKKYGAVEALKDVDFTATPGEVMAIFGDNGAGKSTLIKILSGAVEPTDGTCTVDGLQKNFKSPIDAHEAGIGTLYQDLAVFDGLDVTMNFFIGREETVFGGFMNFGKMQRQTRELVRRFSVRDIDIHSQLLNLSGGQRQIVAITRTTGFGSDYVILDEPTSALSPSAAQEVLDVVRSLADSGIGVIIITHNVAQGLKVADKVTVLRLGRVVGVVDAKSTSEEELVSMIVGANLPA